MRKRVLSLFISLCMALTLAPAAFATEGDETGTPTTNVAAIDQTEYETLAAAVAAAKDGDTIVLLNNITLDGTGKGNNEGILTISKNLTLDGSGKTITATNVTVTGTNGPSMINIQDGAKVTVKDLIIDGAAQPAEGDESSSSGKTKHGLNVYGSGTEVNVENVTIQNGNGYGIVVNGATATIHGLTTSGNGWGGINVDSKSGAAVLTVKTANISEDNSVKIENSASGENKPADPVTTIEDGSFQHINKGDEITELNLTISGGTFSTDSTNSVNITSYIQAGMTLDETGKVVIDDETAVAKIGSVGYDSLSAAIEAAEAGATVELLKSITVTVPQGTPADNTHGALIIDKDITIKGGEGITLTADKTSFTVNDGKDQFSVFNIIGGNVTIEDLTIDGNGQARHGINIFGASENPRVTVNLNNVTSKNSTCYGVVTQGANTTAENLNTSGNGWGGVNVDTKSSAAGGSFTMKSGTLAETGSVVVENSGNKGTGAQVTIDGGNFQQVGIAEGAENASLVINGGTFTTDVTAYVADGKVSVGTDGQFEVKSGTASELVTDLNNKTLKVNESVEFTFSTIANDHAGKMVVGTSNFSDTNAIEKLEYYEVKDGQWYELKGDFGPAQGFSMTDATSKFRVTFNKAGNYSFTASMKLAGTDVVLCSTEANFRVIAADKIPSTITTDIASKSFVTGKAVEFTCTTTANDDKGTLVVGTSDFSDPSAIEKLEYYEVQDGKWYELSGDFGPNSGFPMADATSRFRVTFSKAGTYSFNIYMKTVGSDQVQGDVVLCSASEKITVTRPSSGGGGGGGSAITNYTLTFNTNGGSSIAKVTKSANTTIDLTAYTPTRSGYTFVGWYSDTSLIQKVTSVTLTGNTTVYAKWEEVVAPTPDFPFTDVTSSDYYYDAVVWAVENAITTGDTPTTFAPNAGCTRGQIVTFLWRAAGSPAPKTTVNPFTDVSSSDYYYEAVLWAVEQEITNGTSPTTFSPNDTCTRAHAVTFLYRDAGSPAASGSNPFTDVPAGEYYSAPVLWAVANGVTTGDTPTTFAPNSTCTRGQIVTFLYRAAQ